jgi:ubiquinone/menaquinone biosynthesis C-methylase UbiE
MNLAPNILGPLITGMQAAYRRGENVMAHARSTLGGLQNTSDATLIAYDLQAGSYAARARAFPADNARWCRQLADVLSPRFPAGGSLLEVGVGEATTLSMVSRLLAPAPRVVLGLDLSWSRCAVAREWLREERTEADVFVADLFSIPLADESVDVVYTSHSLEPNGGREGDALRELLRVTRRTLILCEPIYELGGPEAQARMRQHGYVRGLSRILGELGATVSECRLLPYSVNPLNPSGVIIVEKEAASTGSASPELRCPLTHAPLVREADVCFSPLTGMAYPVLRGIPLLRPENAVVAFKIVPPGTAS